MLNPSLAFLLFDSKSAVPSPGGDEPIRSVTHLDLAHFLGGHPPLGKPAKKRCQTDAKEVGINLCGGRGAGSESARSLRPPPLFSLPCPLQRCVTIPSWF